MLDKQIVTILISGILSLARLSGQSLPVISEVPSIQGMPSVARSAAASIDAERIRAHVRFLSLDLLEGRGPGKRGGELAAEYMATQFALAGVKPAGDDNSYFQRVPLMASYTVEDQTRFSLVPVHGEPVSLVYGSDIVAQDQTGQSAADFDVPIVFVGYGIHAPEYGWDDYAGVDIKGKVVLVIVNEPPSDDARFFKGKALTYYGRFPYKYEEAARRGAVGVLIIHRTDLSSHAWDVWRNTWSVEKSYLEGDSLATLHAAAWLHHDAAQRLLTMSGLGDVDAAIDAAGKPGGFHPVELPVHIRGHIESRVRHYTSTNVLGRVDGVAPAGDQSVFYTAHYDHLGIDPLRKGDTIYNGAADNATGCGILLELARAFAQSSVRPPHSVYFASVTGEEQGLLGSRYLALHPPVPVSQITLDLNYDMLLPLGIPKEVDLEGAKRTDFWPAIEATTRTLGLTVLPDPFPDTGRYYRSDQLSFARMGVPALWVGQGDVFEGHDSAWGHKHWEDYEQHHYHQPSDEYQPDWDFRGNAKLAQLGFMLGWIASGRPKPIQWLPGDEFENVRKMSESK